MRKRVVLFGCVMVFLCACTSNDDPEILSKKLSAGYLPLSVGNYWDFKAVQSSTGSIVQHREVNSIEQLNGREYYLVTSHWTSGNSPIDSVYYRVESDGDVYTYRKSMGIEELKYKILAGDGESWSYPVDNGVMNVTLHLGTVNTGSKTVDDCKGYYFDVDRWADEEHTDTLAPGVGFIREYSDAWGVGIILSKASIGGTVIEY